MIFIRFVTIVTFRLPWLESWVYKIFCCLCLFQGNLILAKLSKSQNITCQKNIIRWNWDHSANRWVIFRKKRQGTQSWSECSMCAWWTLVGWGFYTLFSREWRLQCQPDVAKGPIKVLQMACQGRYMGNTKDWHFVCYGNPNHHKWQALQAPIKDIERYMWQVCQA